MFKENVVPGIRKIIQEVYGMIKVLLIQRRLRDYRIPVFNELAKNVDLTVMHTEDKKFETAEFKIIKVDVKRMVFKFYKTSVLKLANQFDVVISMMDYSYPQLLLLDLLPVKCKHIYWGIGVDAGYNHRYDEDQSVAKKIKKLIGMADAAVFYTDYPVRKYTKMGVDPEKLFVANNTVRVEKTEPGEKNTIMFLGSLYPQKRVDLLLEQYIKAYKKDSTLPKLIIIGDGSEREKLEKQAAESYASDNIVFTGAIFDDRILADYFKNALFCLSPDQAGLSVLKSMGCSVPYVTHKNAITGGEIFNIHNGVDGVLFDDFNDMESIFLDAAASKSKYIEMGEKARLYYEKNRTVDQMVKGFTDAVEYSLKKKG